MKQIAVAYHRYVAGRLRAGGHAPDYPEQLCTLLALFAFAVTLTAKTGVAMARLHPIPIKKHGCRVWPLFALCLHTLRKIFVPASPAQLILFLDLLLSS